MLVVGEWGFVIWVRCLLCSGGCVGVIGMFLVEFILIRRNRVGRVWFRVRRGCL